MLDKFLSICNFSTVLFNHAIVYEYLSGVLINCITDLGAKMVMSNIGKIRKAVRELVLDKVIITVRGTVIWQVSQEDIYPRRPFSQKQIQEIRATMNRINFDPAGFLDIDIDALDLSRPDLIMTELQNLKYPVYITIFEIEESPFTNKAEMLRMPDVPPSKFVTYPQYLTYSDELEKRNRLIQTDRILKDYEFKAKRWHKEGDRWLKKEFSFVADFALCEYWGKPSRIGITKLEEDIGKFVD